MTSSPYIVEVDDDVIEAPHHWDRTLLEAFRKIPKIGYLVADLKEDPNDSAYRYLKYVKEKGNVYTSKEVGGVRILEGPTGSGCAMTSREVYDRVGGFGRHKKLVFWHEDAAYVQAVRKTGLSNGDSRGARGLARGKSLLLQAVCLKGPLSRPPRAGRRPEGLRQENHPADPVRAGAERALRLVRAAASLRAPRVRPSTRVSGGLFGRADPRPGGPRACNFRSAGAHNSTFGGWATLVGQAIVKARGKNCDCLRLGSTWGRGCRGIDQREG